MVLSQVVKELRQLSGLSVEEFCRQLNVSEQELTSWESDTETSQPGFRKLLKALSIMVKARNSMDEVERTTKQLSQANAIVATVIESDELNEDHQLALEAAADLVDSAKQSINK